LGAQAESDSNPPTFNSQLKPAGKLSAILQREQAQREKLEVELAKAQLAPADVTVAPKIVVYMFGSDAELEQLKNGGKVK
jgi:hypothetical protein